MLNKERLLHIHPPTETISDEGSVNRRWIETDACVKVLCQVFGVFFLFLKDMTDLFHDKELLHPSYTVNYHNLQWCEGPADGLFKKSQPQTCVENQNKHISRYSSIIR